MGHGSPYYTNTHIKWQKACREFISTHLAPYAQEWETEGNVPEHVFEIFSKHNMLIPNLPAPLPIDLLKSMRINELLGGLRIEDFDYFHFSIYISEMRRPGVGGPTSSLSTGMAYGMPPIITYGSQELQQRLLPDLIRGKKRICIAITEPGAGSDVANISTSAVKSECGKYYIVNGQKKWSVFYHLQCLNYPLTSSGLPMEFGLIMLRWLSELEAREPKDSRFLLYPCSIILVSRCAE
jgi:acyl-CoA dehydrogenase